MVLGDKVYIIARWNDPNGTVISVQDFVIGGELSVPVFSDEEHFVAETKGSGFEHEGVAIDRKFLASILTGTERLALNPGSTNRPVSKEEIVSGVVDGI